MADIQPLVFEFETERLRVRPLGLEDEAMYCSLYTDAKTMRLIGPPLSWEQAARSFRKAIALMNKRPMELLSLTILEKAESQPLGIVGVSHFDIAASRLEIGLMLNRLAHGRSYPGEVLTGFVRCLFDTLPVNEIWAQYACDNRAADRAVRNIGFTLNNEASADAGNTSTCVRSAFRGTWKPRSNRGSI